MRVPAIIVGAALAAAGCGRRDPPPPSPAPPNAPATTTAASAASAAGIYPPSAPRAERTPLPPGSALKTIPQELLDAAMEGHEELVDRAIREGLVDVNAVGPEGRTLLMMAAFNGHAALCRRLVGLGANPRLRDAAGRTALMYAATGPHADTVRILLDAGSDIDAADGGERWTALMFAAAEGQTEAVRLLLERGANSELRDADADRAEEFAARNGHLETARLLREASARRTAGDR